MANSEDLLLTALESVMEQNRQLLADGMATRLLLAEIQSGPMNDVRQLVKLVRDGNGTPSLMSRVNELERWRTETQEQAEAEEKAQDDKDKRIQINWNRVFTVISILISLGSLVILATQ